jgi:large subunit ribosomal protein L28
MARRCSLTGKGGLVGNKVSHSNRKSKTVFRPNLVQVTLASEQLNQSFRLRVSANALRSVEHRGGLDAFLMKADKDVLSRDALAIRKRLDKVEVVA